MRLLIIMLTAFLLSACASAVSSGYGQGGRDTSGRSYTEARADNLITTEVTDALVRDRKVSALDINVRTFDGVVTLTGRVPSAAMAHRAEEIAAAAAGVKRVDNRLQVSPRN
jgi:hyperosmotically inducible protein